jgi:hypothetical protein
VLVNTTLMIIWALSATVAHGPTGLEFAAHPAGLESSGPRVLDEARGELSVAYKTAKPGRRFTVTTFVYQKLPPASQPGESLEHQLESVRMTVAGRYTAFECRPWVPKARPGMSGLECHGRAPEYGDGPLVTFIGLEDVRGWWLKVRATAKAEERDESESDLQAVVAGITSRPTTAKE